MEKPLRDGVLCRKKAARDLFLMSSPEQVVLKIPRKEVRNDHPDCTLRISREGEMKYQRSSRIN